MPVASEATVTEAFARVAELCDDAERYEVAFFESPDGHIIHSFARSLDAEAWIVARPVDADGGRLGGNCVVFVLKITGALRVEELMAAEMAMVAELEAAKADYMAAVSA